MNICPRYRHAIFLLDETSPVHRLLGAFVKARQGAIVQERSWMLHVET